MKDQYPFLYKIFLWVVTICSLLLPFIIWVSYIVGRYKVIIPTAAGELLNYYGTLMGSLGTLILGIATIYLNKKSNDINKRLVELEKGRDKPKIDIESKSICYAEKGQECSLESAVIKFTNHGRIVERVKFTLERIGFSDDNIIDSYYLGEEINCYIVNAFEKKEFFYMNYLSNLMYKK